MCLLRGLDGLYLVVSYKVAPTFHTILMWIAVVFEIYSFFLLSRHMSTKTMCFCQSEIMQAEIKTPDRAMQTIRESPLYLQDQWTRYRHCFPSVFSLCAGVCECVWLVKRDKAYLWRCRPVTSLHFPLSSFIKLYFSEASRTFSRNKALKCSWFEFIWSKGAWESNMFAMCYMWSAHICFIVEI